MNSSFWSRFQAAQYGALQLDALLSWISYHYLRLVLGVPFALLGIIYIGVLANKLGWAWFNFVIATAFIILALAFAFHPTVQLIRKTAHTASSAIPDLKGYTRLVLHGLLFMGLLFVVLGTLEIQHFEAVLPALVLLVLMGFASYLWPTGAFYKRVVWTLLTLFFLGWIVWLYLTASSASFLRGQYQGITGSSAQATYVISSVTPSELTHWNDANRDGRMQSVENSAVSVPAGCYRFTASDTRTKLSHDGPHGPYHELGSITLINGTLRNQPFRVAENEPLRVSFYPFPGTTEYPRVTNNGGYQLMHISLTPSTDCP